MGGSKYIYQNELDNALMLHGIFDTKTLGRAVKIAPNKKLDKELHKLIIRKFENQKVN